MTIAQQRLDALRRLNPAAVANYMNRHGMRMVRIRSREHGAYWGPNNCGYSDRRDRAGLYSLADAWRATSHCGPEKCIHYELVREGEDFTISLDVNDVMLVGRALGHLWYLLYPDNVKDRDTRERISNLRRKMGINTK